MEENRCFDHLFGWAGDLLGVDGLTGSEYNLVEPNDPSRYDRAGVLCLYVRGSVVGVHAYRVRDIKS
jgi:phospholipase C